MEGPLARGPFYATSGGTARAMPREGLGVTGA